MRRVFLALAVSLVSAVTSIAHSSGFREQDGTMSVDGGQGF